MLRKDITSGFQQVLYAIQECQIINLLERLATGRHKSESDKKKNNILNAVQKLRKWACASEKFNDASRTLMKMLNISFLDDPDSRFWDVIFSQEESTKLDADLYLSIKFYVEEAPKMIQLLEQDVDRYSPKETKTEARDRAVLSTLVVEERGFSSPERISMLMMSVSSLYEVCAQLNQVSPTDLCVISCDSGSDKSFDFLGAAKIIEQIRKIILDLWDRVVFYREKKLETHLDLLSQSLPIIEHINSLEKNEKLGREEAEKMRRSISEGLAKFRDSGAVIPEMQERASFSPRKLMAPEQKLLVSDTKNQASDDEEKGKEKTKDQETKKPVVVEENELRSYVEKIAKEVLEKEQATKELSDESKADDSEEKNDMNPKVPSDNY